MPVAGRDENFGHAAFTKSGLAVYDPLVLNLVCPFVWRCSNSRILAFYRKHLSSNHLEAGVGTGYFIDRAIFPAPRPRVGLLDLNANCLERTARRVARYTPETYQANLLQPINLTVRRFDSLAMNYVLHCLPGGFPEKGEAFAHVKPLLNPGSVVFGSTVLASGVKHTSLSSKAIRFFNERGTLHNADDHLDGLTAALHTHLKDVRIEIQGCVALFSGRL